MIRGRLRECRKNWLLIFLADMAAITLSAFLKGNTGLFKSNVLNCD